MKSTEWGSPHEVKDTTVQCDREDRVYDSFLHEQLSTGTCLLLARECSAEGCVKTQEDTTVMGQLVFKDLQTVCTPHTQHTWADVESTADGVVSKTREM